MLEIDDFSIENQSNYIISLAGLYLKLDCFSVEFAGKMQKLLKIPGAIFKTKQNHVKWIWPLERAPSIYLGYELISKTSKLKLDGFSIDGPLTRRTRVWSTWLAIEP